MPRVGAHRPPTARQQPPGAPSVRRATPRSTTGALPRGAARGRAARAHTGQQSAPTAGDPTGHGARADACAAKRDAHFSARG